MKIKKNSNYPSKNDAKFAYNPMNPRNNRDATKDCK